jgi:hypothetical protein
MQSVESSGPIGAAGPTVDRIESLLRVAEAHHTGVPVGTLSDLLPSGFAPTATELADWIRARPDLGKVIGETVFPPQGTVAAEALAARRARGELYWNRAVRLASDTLRPVHPLLRSVALTGSSAYGEPEVGDDLDFLAITRTDAVWVFLAFTYLRLRLQGGPDSDPETGACFNYVMDERTARREFSDSKGLLFAREALTARPVHGEAYYRGLVRSSAWMESELPRAYARWSGPADSPPPEVPGVRLGTRALNLLLFPWIAAYLQVQGMLRNRAFRRSGRSHRVFRTITTYRKLSFASLRFEQLRRHYDSTPNRSSS